MDSIVKVASVPGRPLLIYDGECGFCLFWVHRLQRTARDRLDYLPFQDLSLPARFPELTRARFETAVQLVNGDGRVYGGAEAVFRALAQGPRRERWLRWYQRSPAFARASECAYRFVARHRRLFFALTRLTIRPRAPFDKTVP